LLASLRRPEFPFQLDQKIIHFVVQFQQRQMRLQLQTDFRGVQAGEVIKS
jgi:hypothetical protein